MLQTLEADDDNVSLLASVSVSVSSVSSSSVSSSSVSSSSSDGDARPRRLGGAGATATTATTAGAGVAAPADPYHLTYWAFVMQGVGMLFPWNVFITAAAYYRLRFKGLPQETTFEVVFGFVYTVSNLLALLLILACGASSSALLAACARRFDLRMAVVAPSAATAVLFLLAAVLVFDAAVDGGALYAVTLLSVFLCGVFAACLQAGVFGLSSRLPAKYVQAVVSGQAISGAAVSLMSLVALSTARCDAGEPTLEQIQPQSFAYFFSSTVIVCATLLAFYWLVSRSPVVLAALGRDLLRTPVLGSAAASANGGGGGGGGGTAKQADLVKKMWRHCLGVCLTFAVTLALFPGLTVRIAAAHNPADKTCQGVFSFGVWTSFLFLVFNLGDTLGRQLTLWKHVVRPERAWWLAVGRLVFIPLMLACNLRSPEGAEASSRAFVADNVTASGEVRDGGGGGVAPWSTGFFSDDFWPVLFVGAMAVSNGYVAGMEMMNAPKVFNAPQEQSFAGTVMGFFMTLGLFLGSLLSFIVAAM
jgi:equilibrative nucleoside transporter 1/2/3